MGEADVIRTQISHMAKIRELIDADSRPIGPTLKITFDRLTGRYFLLAMASRLESDLWSVIEAIKSEFPEHPILAEMVKNNVGKRRFHALFRWDANNANYFYKHFGDSCNTFIREKTVSDVDFAKCASAFIRIGSLRNKLIHSDLATYTNPGGMLIKTQVVNSQYESALRFIRKFHEYVRQYVMESKI